jgi:cysteine desulfurase
MNTDRTYLDYNASSPLRPEAWELMTSVMGDGPCNASSVHGDGQRGRRLIEEAREHIASALSARPKDIVFTASATEANNMAIVGACETNGREDGTHPNGRCVATTSVEHPSVIGPINWLKSKRGFDAQTIPVLPSGEVDLDAYREILQHSPSLVTVIAANNETGVIQPIKTLSEAAKERGAIVHLDATQWIGRLPFSVQELPVDMVTLSSHKLGGPQGAGALWIRGGLPLDPLLRGGHQERNRRAGTENVAAIAGFGAAIQAATNSLSDEYQRQTELRERLWQGIQTLSADSRCYGQNAPRLPNTLNVSIPGLDGETLLMGLDLAGISISSGSACTAGSLEPSHVLLAMGIDDEEARGAVRFSLGYASTKAEVDHTLSTLCDLVAHGTGEE